MSYIGRRGTSAPLTSADIPAGSISAVKVASDVATQAELDANATASTSATNALKTNSSITTLGTITAGNFKLSRNEGLIVKYVTAATVDIDADYLTVFDSNSYGAILPAVNLTATITSSGANGLDTGSEAEIWYHIYVIYNGTTVASLLSASATSPTMPSGYTYKKYVGAVYNHNTHFRNFHQIGNDVGIGRNLVSATNFTTSWVTRDYSAWVPTTANKIKGEIRMVNGSSVSGNISVASYGSGTASLTSIDKYIVYVYLYNTSGIQLAGNFNVMARTAQTIYVKTLYATSDGEVYSTGWSYENIV